MKSTDPSLPTSPAFLPSRFARCVAVALGVVCSTASGEAQTIINPSFEVDTFNTAPGTIKSNTAITGWSVTDADRVGLNPAGGLNPYANNGLVPDGQQVAFIRSGNPGAVGLSTTLQGLTAGQTYTVRLRANARSGQKPKLTIGIDGSPIVDTFHNNVGTTNAYRLLSFDFTAAGTSAELGLTNDIATGDHAVLVDNFSIAVSTSKWSFAIWTNDATSGVNPSKLHTHAYRFGNVAPDTTINGITFRGVTGGNPFVAGSFATAGLPTAYSGVDSNVFNVTGGGSAGMSSKFLYNGRSQSITMTGLLPGTEYVASIYSVAFDPRVYGRSATFVAGSDTMTINQNHFGLDNGIVVFYRYIAPPNGTFTLTYLPTDGTPTSFHTCGFANRVANDSEPVIGTQPADAFVAAGGDVTLMVGLNAGSLPVYYQWYCDGALLLDQTNSTLALSNLATFTTNGYSVVITNFLGATTSVVALVETGAAVTGLFNTGVDDANAYLPGGVSDPHYRLVSSPDPFFPGPDVVTMHNGAYPLLASFFTNGPFSSWIAPRTNSTVGNSNGFYVYRTTFIIDTTDASRSRINGRWASDNEGVAILLNGTPTGVSNMVSGAFTKFYPFTIRNEFLAGSNTLDFVISNGPATGPTGLRVEMSGVGRPLAPAAPQIVSQPAATTAVENGTAEFAVLGYGSGPLTYQWYYLGFPLPDATNRVLRLHNIVAGQSGDYAVTISNLVGTVTSQTATLTVNRSETPDSTPPTLTIQSPSAASLHVFSNSVNIAGIAADTAGVASVLVQKNAGEFLPAVGTTNWTAVVPLDPGTNIIRVKALDLSGNSSITNTRIVIFVFSNRLTLVKNGEGTITGATNNQPLEIGKAYPIKVTPAAGYLFSNAISGGIVFTNPSFTIQMVPNLVLTVNLVGSPFLGLKGIYTGLFHDLDEPVHATSGYFSYTLTDKGTYSGKVTVGAKTVSAKGKFNLSLQAQQLLQLGVSNFVTLYLQLVSGSDEVAGSVSNAMFHSVLSGYRAGFDRANPATNFIGNYTTILSGGTNAAMSPHGHGFATFNISAVGAMTLKATLADGSTLSRKGPLSANGQFPVHAPLYRNAGSIFGWLTLLDTDTNGVHGPLLWTKPSGVVGPLYAGGFIEEVATLGARYIAPTSGAPVLTLNSGAALLDGGNLTAPLTNNIALDPTSKVTVAPTNSNKLAITLKAATGAVSGSFVNPVTLKASPLKGVLVPEFNIGAGYFLSTNQSGLLFLGDPADFPLFPIQP